MTTVTLGSTGITVNKNGFGALPVQRVSKEEAAYLLRKAFKAGITYFDSARGYSDSEEKIGLGLADVRDQIIIATKCGAKDGDQVRESLDTSLGKLKTDYIDVYQFHNPSFVPRPGDGTGCYEAMLEAKAQGKIRHIAITNHQITLAEEAVKSGLYEVLQFPFSYLAIEREIELVKLCQRHNVGFVAMKSLSGGLITNSAAAYAFAAQFPNVLPIWGVQREHELDEFISYIDNPPSMNPELQAVIDADRTELSGDFCRGCGYCMPCPQELNIPGIFQLMNYHRVFGLTDHAKEQYGKIGTGDSKHKPVSACVECGQCESKCPQKLEIIKQLKETEAVLTNK